MSYGSADSLARTGRLLKMLFVLLLALLPAKPSLAQTAEQYRQRAIQLSRAKSWDEAIGNYQKAIELEPNDVLTHYNLALALKHKGDARQAAEEFEAVLRLNQNGPMDTTGWARLGTTSTSWWLPRKSSARLSSWIQRRRKRIGCWRAFTPSRAIFPRPRLHYIVQWR